MANEHKLKPPQSHIPVMTARPSQSSLPSSLSTPQLGLTPSGKYLPVSGSPSYPSQPSHSPPGSNTSGGLTPFRSFRNLLSFGPGKNASAGPAGIPQFTNASRTSIGQLHRAQNGERSVSAPHLPPPKGNDTPMLTIELTHRIDEPLFDKDELENRLCLEPGSPGTSSPSPLSSAASLHVVDQPIFIAGSDLSTIIEAENSGISKHIPNLNDTVDIYSPRSASSRISPRTIAAKSLSRSTSGTHDTSALDLSTSNVSNEVLAALSSTGRQGDWLSSGVVVEDAYSPQTEEGLGDPNISFNLAALDPDLAALLSHNKAKRSEPKTLVTVSPPLLTPPLVEGSRALHPQSPRVHSRELATAPSSPQSTGHSPTLSSRQGATTSHLGRSASLTQQLNSRLAPPTSLTRLSRSASEKPTFFSTDSPLPSPTKAEPVGRQSLQLPRRDTASLLAESPLPNRPTSSDGNEFDIRRPALSRLVTPSRHLAAANTARATRRNLPTPTSSPGRDGGESAGSRSPPGSSSSRRFGVHRPSLDTGHERPLIRGRDRSASLSENPAYARPQQGGVDLLGPRTAKAFAAAGLLDTDRDAPGPSASRAGSRFGFAGGHSDRDFRSQYAPSRAGFSEMGSSSSWGRRSGSISHTVASSELGTPNTESMMTTPRTTYSAASTAPTSISAVSSMHKHLESELQQLQERHTTETGALLNALSDSQRTSRMLREENAQLRDRVQYLEEELADTQDALHKLQFAPTGAATLPRTNFYRAGGRPGLEPLRRPLPHSRLQTLLHPPPNDEDERNRDMDTQPDAGHHATMPLHMPSKHSLHEPDTYSNTRRYSNSSSIFPAPPSNMPMLLNEDGGSLSMSPPSPTLQFGKLPTRQGHHRTTSSGGNISPTTANFSMMTGSPRSLDLRSEHERLLGDMPSLDLRAEDYESHAYYEHDR